ncbi:MAG: FecR domain-containing protein [Bacteroidota bacterium]
MEKDPTYYHDLTAKYFAGELAGEELSALSAWLSSDAGNQKVFREYKKAWEAIEKSKIEALDTDAEWAMLKSKIPSQRIEEKETKVIKLDTETTTRRIFFRQALRIAAVLIVLAGITFVIINYLKQPPSQKQFIAINEKVEGKLPDGSTVTLNAGSTLDYPEKFTGDERSVKLTGEAFFDVASDKSKPFIVSANDIMVEVVGTSFFVSAGSNGDVEVIVKTGKVAVYRTDNPSEKKILEPGDKAEFSSDNKIISELKNEDDNFISWKTNVLTFSDDSLSDVVATLNKHYKANISITDDKLKGLKLTGTYTDNSLDQILTLIESTIKIRVTKKSAKQIELSGYDTK